jgi:hypothetical protein
VVGLAVIVTNDWARVKHLAFIHPATKPVE